MWQLILAGRRALGTEQGTVTLPRAGMVSLTWPQHLRSFADAVIAMTGVYVNEVVFVLVWFFKIQK